MTSWPEAPSIVILTIIFFSIVFQVFPTCPYSIFKKKWKKKEENVRVNCLITTVYNPPLLINNVYFYTAWCIWDQGTPNIGFKSHVKGKIYQFDSHQTYQSFGGKGKKDKVAGGLYSRIYYKTLGKREAEVSQKCFG